ncbi:putative phage tail protein [Viridibacillus sp. NPDC096237]|uniref:putative phage tail protein n=1 Tax=Viridibacillus sp. NPDC096237 TaxID=3390721 RepID=UPI003CFEA4E4
MDNYLDNEIDLFPLLPPTINELKEFKEITRVESTNFNVVRQHLINIFKDRFVHEATEQGVRRWEKMLKLKRRSIDTLDERKFRILAKMNNKLPYTMRTLEQLLNSLCGKGNYNLLLDPYELELFFEFYTKIPDVQLLKDTLEQMIPLNLLLHYMYTIKVPAIKVSAREHVYPVMYPITNVAVTNNDGVGVGSTTNIDIPVRGQGYQIIYPITNMVVTY